MGVARGRCWAAGVVAGVLACVLAVAPSASADVPSVPASGGASQCVPDRSTIAQCFPDKALAQDVAGELKGDRGKTGEVLTSDDVKNTTRLWARDPSVSSVQGLQVFTKLEDLYLSGTKVSDVSALANLTGLNWLDLSGTKVSDVSALAKLTKLEHLDLSGTQVSDATLASVAKLTNLEDLHLYLSNTQVSDVSALAKLTNLNVLDLSGTRVSDVSALAKLTNLFTLDLSGTRVSDVSSLAGMTNLNSLGLSDTKVSDAALASVAKLTNLWSLDLSKTQVSDVSALANLTELNWLDLSNTQVSDAALASVAKLTNLRDLNLSDTKVSDAALASVAKLTTLWSLELSGTRVSDAALASVAKLTELETLDLSNTQVSDVSALAKLTKLENLDLSGTRVLDLRSLRGLPLSSNKVARTSVEVTSFADVRPSVKLTVNADGSVSLPAPRWLDGTWVAPSSTSPTGGVLDAKRGVVTWKKYDAGASYSYDFRKYFTLNDGGAVEFSGHVTARVVFRDVSSSTPHASDIAWLADAGVSTGWREPDGSYSFRGMDSVKRQDMAAFLRREASRRGAAGVPAGAGYARFRDVSSSTPHADDIGWLADAKVSEGWVEPDGSRTFRGMDSVKRQDMAAFLRREATLMGVSDAASWKPSDADWKRFRDVTPSTPHAEDVLWLAHAGVSTGYADGTFGGMLPVYRQDMAAFLHRLDGLKK
ncbi:leucine-rich repeat domain-containing protein [Bifidobacterium boum]|uniref:leucine-rich repeat domain-containing protein n=1 Tax=Bifidobacterium boum TaxID=78343 RepID=UPI003995A1A0